MHLFWIQFWLHHTAAKPLYWLPITLVFLLLLLWWPNYTMRHAFPSKHFLIPKYTLLDLNWVLSSAIPTSWNHLVIFPQYLWITNTYLSFRPQSIKILINSLHKRSVQSNSTLQSRFGYIPCSISYIFLLSKCSQQARSFFGVTSYIYLFYINWFHSEFKANIQLLDFLLIFFLA